MTGDAVDGSVVLRFSVTINAPAHVEGVGYFYFVHSVDLTMTFGAIHAALNMRCMAELHVVRKVMNFDPFYRSTFFPVTGQLLNLRAAGRRLTVTIHASIDTGHRGVGSFTGADVAITAGDFVNPGVQLVTKCEGLFGGVSFPRIKAGRKPDRGGEKEHPSDGQVSSFHTSNYSVKPINFGRLLWPYPER